MRARQAAVVVIGGLAVCVAAAGLGAQSAASVGVATRIEQLVLPGSLLEARPRDDPREPVVLRVLGSYPHGDAHRYDLEYYGLDPGRYDLRDYLRRVDGSSLDGVPAIPVEIVSVLPPGMIEPNPIDLRPVGGFGGYRTLLIVGGVVWGVGLLALLLVRRRRRQQAHIAAAPPTLADRLRPRVEAAIAGRLSPEGIAELERMLLGYWRRRLGLADLPSADAIAALRADAEAGALLQQLDAWLHRPGGGGDVDVAALLAPYQHVTAESIEVAP